ncbi:MAG: arylsulfatase [Acidobacteria bacterium]|nr:arylsulfatase [Acidobacteriota bacterium]MCW5966922.1 arylsulfatase [Blastocatellales bacterium]
MKPIVLLAAAVLFPAVCVPSAAPMARRPNIIFIMADDLGYGDLGSYGQRIVRTPNLDRMAAEGIRFTQYYAGSTVCAPSRSVLMTGQHTGHTWIRGNSKDNLRPEDITVAEVLRGAGYATGLVGKWGLGHEGSAGVPTRKGFDSFFGYLDQTHAHNYYPTFLVRDESRVKLRNVVPNEGSVGQGMASERIDYSHDLMTDEALAFIDRHAAKQFFLYLAYTLPHANNEARERGMEVPDFGEYADRDWPDARKAFAAMVARLDRDVGRVLERLKERGIDRETIVFFTSDNGPHREGGHDPDFFSSTGVLRGIKRDLYEGGIRVPMIVRWPGRVRAGQVSRHVWGHWDFLPTAAEIAGVRAPDRIDGRSMLSAILGRKAQTQPYLYWEFHERGFKQAVRAGDWKAVRLAPDKPLELYDLRSDLGETRDIAARHPEVVRRIEGYLRTARTESTLWPVNNVR